MKLLFLNHNVAWTGTFFRAYHLGRHLASRGHQVTVVTTSPRERLRFGVRREDGVRLVLAPDLFPGRARTGWDPVNVLQRIRYLRLDRYDLIHAFDSRPAVILPAQAMRRSTGAHLVLDWADWWGRGGSIQERSGALIRTVFAPIETWFEEAFRAGADGTTVISHALRARAEGLGVRPGTILVCPQGSDPVLFDVLDRSACRSRLPLPPADPLLLHLGIALQPDVDLLMDAFREARRSVPAARLALVGSLRARVPEDLLRSGAVQRVGRVSLEQLRLWLGAADAGVVTMRDTIGNRGRWPSKINDYLAAGRAVVMTRVGDAAPLVECATAGWVATPEPEPFGEALVAALQDSAAREQRGGAARALAEGPLNWANLAQVVERYYDDVLSGRVASRRRAGAK